MMLVLAPILHSKDHTKSLDEGKESLFITDDMMTKRHEKETKYHVKRRKGVSKGVTIEEPKASRFSLKEELQETMSQVNTSFKDILHANAIVNDRLLVCVSLYLETKQVS